MRRRKDESNRSSHAHSHAEHGCTRLACGRAQDVSFAKEKGGKTRYRMMSSHWKQWRMFKGWKTQKKSVIGAHNRCWGYLRGAILMHGEAKRNLEFIGGERDRQLQQLWAETKIGDILPWEDVEREAERLLESTRVNARDSGVSVVYYRT